MLFTNSNNFLDFEQTHHTKVISFSNKITIVISNDLHDAKEEWSMYFVMTLNNLSSYTKVLPK